MTLRVPPVLQLAAFGLTAWAAAKLFPGLSFRLGTVGTIGVVALATIGAVILLASLGTFRKSATTVNPIHPGAATSLVTGGLYRYTRNPMYLSFALLLAAGSLALGNLAAFVIPVLFVMVMTEGQIKLEERILRNLFGRQYENYCRQTRRWI